MQKKLSEAAIKKLVFTIILCLLPLAAVANLFYSLETYYSVVHNECGVKICFRCVIAFIISLIIWVKYKSTAKYMTWIFILSTVILCAVFYVANKIPFCVVCDQVTAEDLGFLTHWISPLP